MRVVEYGPRAGDLRTEVICGYRVTWVYVETSAVAGWWRRVSVK